MKVGITVNLDEFVKKRFGDRARLTRLAGDASDRTFYRLSSPTLSPMILMAHREPFDLETQPFFLHGRFLLELGMAVPQIIASYPAEGIFIVSDLGDDMLQEHLRTCDPARRRFLYLQAVQMIAFLQDEGTRALHLELPAANTALDAERLLFELRFFSQHYVQGLLGSPLSEEQEAALDDWFVSLAREVSGLRRVLCHRDFHSRNLMVKSERLYMVDFQDLRMGPYTYDLASLLRDSYVKLPDDLVGELIEFFREAARIPESPARLRGAFTMTSLQRNIKAIGTFASQVTVRGNSGYLKYIGNTLDNIRAGLALESNTAMLALFEGPLDYRP